MIRPILNKNKSIGQVVYIFEGEEFESKLFTKIFCDLLDYNVVSLDKNSTAHLYTSKINKYSRVYLIPSKKNNVKNLFNSREYYDELYNKLSHEYELDVENSAIYYIFDRDRANNKSKDYINAIKTYKNSRENDNNEMNGLFLPNYPAAESFLLNANNDNEKCKNGQLIKLYLAGTGYAIDKLQDNNLIHATAKLLNEIVMINGADFKISEIDDFVNINMSIYDYEEYLYTEEGYYLVLSLICVSLIDLGIIELWAAYDNIVRAGQNRFGILQNASCLVWLSYW